MVVEAAKPCTEEPTVSSELKSDPDAGSIQPFVPSPRDCFLVSFLVDARGGSMRGSRHPGLRVLVPPSAASAPTRITCRMLRPERTTRPPQLNDSEGLACRIIELGPHPCTFNSPVILEIPHFASLRGRQRELVVLRSDNAETWREHSLEATDQAVQSALGQSFDTLETMEELREKRIIRILTNDFPQYLAVVSRLRQETALIGSDGGVLSSTVVPQVQAVFPEGALQKRIRVGLQAHPIPTEMVTRLLGNRVAASPIVTLEPRRRKFHKPITLTIPLPKPAMRGMLNPGHGGDLKSQGAPSLRLLCSITGGTLPAQWEDITGSTPLSKVKDCVSFTTTVSARFWLIDCQAVHESTELAGQLYREASLVPYMGKFVVFTKRLDTDEALIRCFCVTDDKVDKTLECQEGFEVCAASPEVEVVEGRPAWLEAAGNLLPVAKSDEQLKLHFNAFRENRLAFPVRLRDMHQEPSGKLAFMREPRHAASAGTDSVSTTPQKPICTLEVHLGPEHEATRAAHSTMVDPALASLTDQLSPPVAASLHSIPCVFPAVSRKPASGEDGDDLDTYENELNVLGPEGRWASVYAADVIARSQLDLLQVAAEIGSDWPRLVGVLLPESQLDANCTVEQLVAWIGQNEPNWQETRADGGTAGLSGLTVSELRTERDRALAVLLAWREQRGDQATGNELDRALRAIGRMDVIKSCMLDIRCVTEQAEHAEATRRIDDRSLPEDQMHRFTQDSPEPTSASLVGTTTLMSGMDDLSSHAVVQGVLTDTVHASAVEEELLAPQQTQLAESVAPSHLREEEEDLSSQAAAVHQEPTDQGEPIVSSTVVDQPIVSKTEEDDRQGREDQGEEDDLELGTTQYTEDHWESGSPPATTTSQQGGDPLVVHAAAQDLPGENEEVDHVRESESMTASIDGSSAAAATEDAAGTFATEEDPNALAPVEPQMDMGLEQMEHAEPTTTDEFHEGSNETAQHKDPDAVESQSDIGEHQVDQTQAVLTETDTADAKPATEQPHAETEQDPIDHLEALPVEHDQTSAEGEWSGAFEEHQPTEQSTEQCDEFEAMTTTNTEPATDEQHLRDAHHEGGELPSPVDLGDNVTYYSEEYGGVDGGDHIQATEGEPQFSGHLVTTAHHGVETGTVTHPPPEHSMHEE